MTRTEQLEIMWQRAFDLGCLLDGYRGMRYLSIANRIQFWINEREFGI
jgi:hypothetical protein